MKGLAQKPVPSTLSFQNRGLTPYAVPYHCCSYSTPPAISAHSQALERRWGTCPLARCCSETQDNTRAEHSSYPENDECCASASRRTTARLTCKRKASRHGKVKCVASSESVQKTNHEEQPEKKKSSVRRATSYHHRISHDHHVSA